ncbi:CinA family nicotinamide mononucleotide deamidase-related protein [Euzebya sp.]|uniref:CinA family nicotinamide mononucleotide deamidase-related protein n=1 Tax=Euzebya sp. TaxID=1971409 RepID=UPI0035181CF1
MRAELVAVGTELVSGDVVDTNSSWLSARLVEIGVDVTRHTAVGDDVALIAEVLDAAVVGQADVVLLTGGLGPTRDDLTREAVARVAGVPLVRDQAAVEDIAGFFAARGIDMPATNLQQADLPEGARWLPRIGTAPGIAIEVRGTLVCCLPGVPSEAEAMFTTSVAPLLTARGDLTATVTRTIRTAGVGESHVAAVLADLVDSVEAVGNPTLAFLAARGEVVVKVIGRGPARADALAAADPIVERAVALLGRAVVGLDDEGIEADIGRRLSAAGLTVAVGESITGGGVGARLSSVPGASTWFAGGLITYATAAKSARAGVDADLLAAEGPVSEPVAEALAVGALDRLEADVAVSVVGVAGPATQGGQPVGTVVSGTDGPDGLPRARRVELPGSGRAEITERAVAAALAALHRYVVRLTS